MRVCVCATRQPRLVCCATQRHGTHLPAHEDGIIIESRQVALVARRRRQQLLELRKGAELAPVLLVDVLARVPLARQERVARPDDLAFKVRRQYRELLGEARDREVAREQ